MKKFNFYADELKIKNLDLKKALKCKEGQTIKVYPLVQYF